MEILLSVIAILVSISGIIFNTYYTRKTFSKQSRYEHISKQIRESIKKIRSIKESVTSPKDYPIEGFPNYFSNLNRLSESIVIYMHENDLENFTLTIEPSYLTVKHYKDSIKREAKDYEPDSFQSPKHLFLSKDVYEVTLFLKTEPVVMRESWRNSYPVYSLIQINSFADLYQELLKETDIISSVDSQVIEEMRKTFNYIISSVLNSASKKHKFVFKNSMKPKSINLKILNRMFSRLVVTNSLKYLSDEICERLDTVQKELFQKS